MRSFWSSERERKYYCHRSEGSLDTSESTVRRDITALDKEGKLEKVFGGAVELKERGNCI